LVSFKKRYVDERLRAEVDSAVYDENFLKVIKSDSEGSLSYVISSIKASKVVETKKVENVEYKTVENSEAWNGFAIAYLNKKDFANAKNILESMLSAGASDSLTINNYAAVLLNEMIEKNSIIEKVLSHAKELTFKALKFDVRKKGELIEGASRPPFKNLVLIRNIEAEVFLKKRDFFTAFVLAWISVEMSLTRIWFRFLKDQGYGKKKRQWFADWDIAFVIESLSMLGIIDPHIKNDLDCLRTLRNDVIHGILPYPEEGQISRCIKLGRELIPILQ